MERREEISTTELKDEYLDDVSGGTFRFIRAIFYSGTTEGQDRLSRNAQAWVTSAT